MTHDQYIKFNMAISSAANRAKLTEVIELVKQIPECREKNDLARNAAQKWFELPEAGV